VDGQHREGRGRSYGDRAGDRPVHDRADRVPGAAEHDLHRPHAVPVEHDRGQQVGRGLVRAGRDDGHQQQAVRVLGVQGREDLVLDLRRVVREERRRGHRKEAQLGIVDRSQREQHPLFGDPDEDEPAMRRETRDRRHEVEHGHVDGLGRFERAGCGCGHHTLLIGGSR